MILFMSQPSRSASASTAAKEPHQPTAFINPQLAAAMAVSHPAMENCLAAARSSMGMIPNKVKQAGTIRRGAHTTLIMSAWEERNMG